MRIQVFDIGNSNLKKVVWEVSDKSCRMHQLHVTPTSKNMAENLSVIRSAYENEDKDAVIILSMGDCVVWQAADGSLRWIPPTEPAHAYVRDDEKPHYRETGKPQGGELPGVFNQLKMIYQNTVAGRPLGRTRVLPMSTMVAAQLADDKYFNNWDITQASNSGVFSYQLPSHDERFPLSGWHPCIENMLEAKYFSRHIVRPSHMLTAKDGTPILIGGHDTTFVNALDKIYSTKPYVSAGTWLSVSVESSVRPNWRDQGARYVIAPNGAVLKQLCFKSPETDEGREMAADKILSFLSKHLPEGTDVPIQIFGGWRESFAKHLCLSHLNFVINDSPHLESEMAARYAKSVLEAA